uniref:Uncharacterized protein LOC111111912 isoform X1 n=1 Tax=Crassostrea virginica TaxID=6565 RepID=A0A8B8BPL2_CRAVI|nr:uncharacterized protein LOC111111912 isoform X1 [Crassostrea virginica]
MNAECSKAIFMDRCRSLRLIFVGICLFSIFPSDECKKVEEGYKFAVYRTRACPRNKTEWEKRESAFNCSKESSSYTCLPNENITELLEFCYPLQVLASHEDICLFLAKKNSDVDSYDCTHFDHGCPTGFYTGATMYKYQSCLSIGKGCFLAEPSCERATQHREPENPHGTSGSETIWIPILVGALVLFAIFVLAIVKYKRRNCNQQTNDEENPETHQLLLQTDKENDREGRNCNQQTNDEENPETHQLLLQTDKENDREGRNCNQQTNDEENPETHQLLLQTDKENDREGSNFNQQTNDEENPETHQLLLQTDKENDREGRFTNIVARWPGSCHDSHIFRMSGIKEDLERNFRAVGDGILLGDSGYACMKYLMTPYLRPSTPAEERFNTAHSKTRVTIERTFGWWKRRFHVLHSEIRMHPERVCTIIGACAVLHNLAIIFREPLIDEDCDVDGSFQGQYIGPEDGKNIRNYITQNYF